MGIHPLNPIEGLSGAPSRLRCRVTTKMKQLHLTVIPGTFAVVRSPAATDLRALVPDKTDFWSVTRTAEETSLVTAEENVPELADAKVECGWRMLKVEGPLPFEMTGVVSSLTQPLAVAKIGVFVISTFDTDYLLVKDEQFETALRVLAESFTIAR